MCFPFRVEGRHHGAPQGTGPMVAGYDHGDRWEECGCRVHPKIVGLGGWREPEDGHSGRRGLIRGVGKKAQETAGGGYSAELS